jgi:hypothetical protein
MPVLTLPQRTYMTTCHSSNSNYPALSNKIFRDRFRTKMISTSSNLTFSLTNTFSRTKRFTHEQKFRLLLLNKSLSTKHNWICRNTTQCTQIIYENLHGTLICFSICRGAVILSNYQLDPYISPIKLVIREIWQFPRSN